MTSWPSPPKTWSAPELARTGLGPRSSRGTRGDTRGEHSVVAGHEVRTGVAVEAVTGVGPADAGARLLEGAADDLVLAGVAVDEVGAVVALEVVGVVATVDLVVAEAAVGGVVAGAAVDDVAAAGSRRQAVEVVRDGRCVTAARRVVDRAVVTDDDVVARVSADRVAGVGGPDVGATCGTRAAVEDVVAVAAADAVGAVVALDDVS